MPSHAQGHRQVLAVSGEGRPIEGVYLGVDDPDARPLDTLVIGVFHGDEGVSGRLLERLLSHIARPGTDTPLPDWRKHPALVIPVLNPDGLHRRQRGTARGVDLNRNYPTANWVRQGEGTPYYSGPEPASEPETRLVMQLIDAHRPRKILTVHSPYKVINFDGPGRALAEAMAAHSGYPVVADIGYPTPGSFGTYAGKERNIPVITLELPPAPEDPPHDDQDLPVEPLDQVWADNAAALLAGLGFQIG